MVYVANNQFLDHLCADSCVVRLLPAWQLVENVKTKRIAVVEEMLIWRIMRHPDGIHIHALHQLDIVVTDSFAKAPARIRPETVSIATLEQDTRSVDVKALVWPKLDCPEAKLCCRLVNHRRSLHQANLQLIEIWGFSGPEFG